MKLMQNDPARKGLGKYALIRLDKLTISEIDTMVEFDQSTMVQYLLEMLRRNPDLIEFGYPDALDEFFVIKLKDENAVHALDGYIISEPDGEFVNELAELTERAGYNSKYYKETDYA